MNELDDLKKNNKTHNQLALYFLFEYGKEKLKNDDELSKMKESIKERNKGKTPILDTDFEIEALDIARQMANASVNDLCKYIYNDVKGQKPKERSR